MNDIPPEPRTDPAATVDALERKVAREADPIPEYDGQDGVAEDAAPGTASPEPPD
jgi:hypothetical protein